MEIQTATAEQQLLRDNIVVELVKKTKKNEPKILPSLNLVDKEAFKQDIEDGGAAHRMVMREFWHSVNYKIIIARNIETQTIQGYAIFSDYDLKEDRFGKKFVPSVYLHRIGVKRTCRRLGIGRKLVNYLLETYPQHALSLEVNTESAYAVAFYKSFGLKVKSVYLLSEEDEFAVFETPLDKNGRKIM